MIRFGAVASASFETAPANVAAALYLATGALATVAPERLKFSRVRPSSIFEKYSSAPTHIRRLLHLRAMSYERRPHLYWLCWPPLASKRRASDRSSSGESKHARTTSVGQSIDRPKTLSRNFKKKNSWPFGDPRLRLSARKWTRSGSGSLTSSEIELLRRDGDRFLLQRRPLYLPRRRALFTLRDAFLTRARRAAFATGGVLTEARATDEVSGHVTRRPDVNRGGAVPTTHR